jgi:DNA-binding winged helix-turn-helix (wHTH) protein/tetratricopeptide (TPR) repeat protein
MRAHARVFKGRLKISQRFLMETKPSRIKYLYEFGPFRLDPQKRLLTRGTDPVSLTPKVIETLVVLIENRDRVVSKDDLMKILWPDSFVEESNLSQNVFVLRKALGDSSQERRYIVNVPGRGYQFAETVREVEQVQLGAQLGTMQEVEETLRLESRSRARVVVEQVAPRRGPIGVRTGIAVAIAALIGVGVLVYRSRVGRLAERTGPVVGLPAVKMRPAVAVLGFRNLSGREDTKWLSVALVEMLNTELAAGEHLRIIPGEQVARASRDVPWGEADTLAKDSLLRLRSNLGTDYVALGSYTILEDGNKRRIRLDLRLQDAAAGETVAEDAVTGNEADLFDLISEAGSRMRERLAIGNMSREQAAQARSSLPSNPKAERLYAEGLAKLESFDALAARDLFEKATGADPKHALSHSGLAEAWAELGYDTKAREEAAKAFGLSHNLSREEQLSIEGRYRELSNDLPAAIEIYRTLRTFFPDDLDYALRLASAQSRSGQGKDALQTVALMRSLGEPANKDARIDLAEASAAEALSDFRRSQQAAVAAATRADAQGSHLLLAVAKSREAWASVRLGDTDRAFAAYSKARQLWIAGGNQRSAAAALSGIANLLGDKGDFVGARKAFDEALLEFRKIGDMGNLASCSHNLGVLLTQQGDLPQARKHLEEALSLQRAIKNERGVASDLDDIGNVMLSMGDTANALRVKEQALEIFRRIGNKFGEGVTTLNMGEVLFAQDRLNDARTKYDEAMAVAQHLGSKRELGYCLADIAGILIAQDRLDEARTAAERSIEVRKEIHGEVQLAESQIRLAQALLEQGKPAEAEPLAHSAAAVFDKQDASGDASLSYSVLAQLLMAEGKPQEAQAAANRGLRLARASGDVWMRFESELAAARAKEATGKLFEAREELAPILVQSAKFGSAGYGLQARLLRGEIEAKSGQFSAARAELTAVKSEAQLKDFRLIARKATASLANLPR